MRDSPVTAAMLTDWLRGAGNLLTGAVIDLTIELQVKTDISSLDFVTAAYSAAAPPDLPRQLVVKSPLKATGQGDRAGEVGFYRNLAPSLATPPLVRCLAAIAESGDTPEVLVLEDVRATHDHPTWPIPPSRAHSELGVDALAAVHSQWWESPSLGRTVGDPHTTESLTAMVQGIAASVPPFFDAVGDSLTAEARRVYDRVFSSPLRPWLRIIEPRALTVVHGDAHSWNFLFPHGAGAAYLIDWQLWHVDVGTRDLAFMIALHWYPSRRRELEEPMLRRYHRGLVDRGVENYPFDELMLDYKRCVVRNLTIPILFWRRGMKPEGWWHRLECTLAAYADLGCEELL